VIGRRRLKQRLLEGLADDNIELIHNHPRGTIRRRRQERTERLNRTRRFVLAGGTMVVVAGAVVTLGLQGSARADRSDAVTADVATSAPARPPARTSDESSSGLAEVLSGEATHPVGRGAIPLTVHRVVIDAGHGGRDGGAVLPGLELLEKDLTLDIARRLNRLLSRDVEVVMTRTGDVSVPLKERTEIANDAAADLFVSIHVNWLPDREARGFETYYGGATGDPFLEALAAVENRDSGFSMADTRRLLDGIYSGVRRQESRRLAEWVSEALFETLGTSNPEVVDRGVMRAPFVVLVATDMPAVLAEVACISNDREARLLGLTAYRQRIAEALYRAISGYTRELNSTDKGEAA
jgi:N-acetylmuramoyl-L-alanine amidase